ncbi:MAG: hydrogenase formation protein HypD [Candidatus Hadarchaeia archaeon]
MKELTDHFRDPEEAERISQKIRKLSEDMNPVKLMNVCGTHEMNIVKHGIRNLLPKKIKLIAGPGCPVCVTPSREIDEAIELAEEGKKITTFGDMYRVPGSSSSLTSAKTKGADVQIVYGISDAVEIAAQNPGREVVHVAIGFETTAPTTAAEMLREPPENFSILTCHRVMPPVMEHLLTSGETDIDGYICPGHVSTIIGAEPYRPLSKKFEIPQVIAGFEPLDILLSVLMLLRQMKEGRNEVENEYERFVREKGNERAKNQMKEVFDKTDDFWRGFPKIPKSKLELRGKFEKHDARKKFDIETEREIEFSKGCRCDEVLKGLIDPKKCPFFLNGCSPDSPKGPCMVSAEGTCSVWARHGGSDQL